MRISVIIPTLNEVERLGDTLGDLEEALPVHSEVIVADGGSCDGTRELAERFSCQVVDSSAGRARQMNAGAGRSSGDILWFLHADTRIPAEAGTALLSGLSAGHSWGRFDIRLSGSRRMFRLVERMMNIRSCRTGIVTGDHGLFVTRDVFDAAGGFPDIPLMEDVALSKALRKRNKPVCVGTRLVMTSSRRWEEQGVWRTILLMWRLRLAYALGVDPQRLVKRYYP